MQRGAHSEEWRILRASGAIFVGSGVLAFFALTGVGRVLGLLFLSGPGVLMMLRARRAEDEERRASFRTTETLRHPVGCLGVAGTMVVGGLCWWLARGPAPDWGLFVALVGVLLVPVVLRWWWRQCHSVHCAAYGGHAEAVRRMLTADSGLLEQRAYLGRTPLHLAAAAGHDKLVALLLSAGANMNAAADGGWTALHWAAMRGHPEVVRILLNGGAEVDPRAQDGSTPLYWAAREGFAECVGLFLMAGADAGKRDYKGRSPQDVAAKRGHDAVVKLLHGDDALRLGRHPGAQDPGRSG